MSEYEPKCAYIEEGENAEESLKKWLDDGGEGIACAKRFAASTAVFIRLPKTDKIDYLFSTTVSHDEDLLRRDADFKFAGIYSREERLFYCEGYDLALTVTGSFYSNKTTGRDTPSLLAAYSAGVCEAVEKAVGNSKANLKVTELTNENLLREIADFKNRGAAREARKAYLSESGYPGPVFHCQFKADQWDDRVIVEYITDPAKRVKDTAEEYMKTNQELMYKQLLELELLDDAYNALMQDTQNPVHTVKKIMTAMRKVPDAKTVNVTIFKDGTEFTFKTETRELFSDCESYYGTWDMAAPDRRKFKDIFGKNSNYRPDEITKITYGRNTLYAR